MKCAAHQRLPDKVVGHRTSGDQLCHSRHVGHLHTGLEHVGDGSERDRVGRKSGHVERAMRGSRHFVGDDAALAVEDIGLVRMPRLPHLAFRRDRDERNVERGKLLARIL